MARPRVFISSTYYDLKHVRSSLENFIDSLGYDATLSEKGDVAYAPDRPLDESCYREVENSDVLVLIVGGRYGSEMSDGKTTSSKTFYERYNSITRGEYQSAVRRGVPIYVLVERSVYAEYETYLRNKTNTSIRYAHVDSINIFSLIEEILSQPRNNPIQQFERYSEIEAWLREQWAGLFRELLRRMQSQQEIASLQAQVGQLADLNKTLKRYLEDVVSRLAPANESQTLINSETKRLQNAAVERVLRANQLSRYLLEDVRVPMHLLADSVGEATSAEDFLHRLEPSLSEEGIDRLSRLSQKGMIGLVSEDLDELRESIGLPRLASSTKRWSRSSGERSNLEDLTVTASPAEKIKVKRTPRKKKAGSTATS